VNGRNAGGNLSVVWLSQPLEFHFADGTKRAVTLEDLSVTCSSGNNCLAGYTYYMAGTLVLLNGPTPLSRQLWLKYRFRVRLCCLPLVWVR
jgi:hypothetical protein